MLYEAALGLGIAAGPLVGGLLGDISWRGPFFGVAVLMAIALVATVVLLDPTPKPAHRTSLAAPLKALRHRGLLTMGVTALLYNWGFFTMLGYAPFPMGLDAIQLGFVFFGWGLLVAFFSVFGAPRLQARFGTAPVAVRRRWRCSPSLLLVIATVHRRAAGADRRASIVAGIFIGINNTLTTQAVMLVSPVERPVASAAYGFVRFIGGGLAPFAAGKLAEHFGVHVPFFVGAVAVAARPSACSPPATGCSRRADEALAAGEAAHAGESDLDAAELEEVLEDSTGEAGARLRAEVPPPAR